MDLFVIIEAPIKPERRDEFLELMSSRFLPEARSFDGCLGVDMYSMVEDPNRITFHEHWESRGQFEKYAAWRVATGHMKEMEAYYDGSATVLLAKALATQIGLGPK